VPQVRASFNWLPSENAEFYEIYLETTLIDSTALLVLETELDLSFGTHRFSVRGINADGSGPFRSTQVILEEPYVPQPPGPIGDFNVSLMIIGSGGGGNPTPPNTEPYDLTNGGLRTVPFAYSWPAPPVITRTVSVTTAAQFNAEAAIDGTLINITASFAGTKNVLGSDIDIVVANNTIDLTGDMAFGNQNTLVERVRWTGGNLFGTFRAVNTNDILFNDFYAESNGTLTVDLSQAAGRGFNRIAFINTTLRVINGSSASDWAIFMQQSAGSTDLIMANAKLFSTGQNNRFQSVTNLILVDSVFNPDGASANGMRVHYESTNVFVADSWSRNLFKLDNSGPGDPGPSVLNATFDNYDRYYDSWAFQGSFPNTGVVRNSTLFGGTISVSPLADGGGNSSLAWDGSTVPDYSGVGAIR